MIERTNESAVRVTCDAMDCKESLVCMSNVMLGQETLTDGQAKKMREAEGWTEEPNGKCPLNFCPLHTQGGKDADKT